jgi:hypothetical protein
MEAILPSPIAFIVSTGTIFTVKKIWKLWRSDKINIWIANEMTKQA